MASTFRPYSPWANTLPRITNVDNVYWWITWVPSQCSLPRYPCRWVFLSAVLYMFCIYILERKSRVFGSGRTGTYCQALSIEGERMHYADSKWDSVREYWTALHSLSRSLPAFKGGRRTRSPTVLLIWSDLTRIHIRIIFYAKAVDMIDHRYESDSIGTPFFLLAVKKKIYIKEERDRAPCACQLSGTKTNATCAITHRSWP
jgi:hypothetical protein